MSDRAHTVAAARLLASDGRFETQLGQLVAVPSESQNPNRTGVLKEYLTEQMIPRLVLSGFETTIHSNPEGPPFLTACRIEDPDLPTVLVYGHGDVVHGQESSWDTGLAPFTLTRRGERLYGRGAADNKGQHLINLIALEAVLAAKGRLGFNIKLLFEMGEETGSPGLEAFCAGQRDTLAADVLIASDGPRLRPERATVFLGSRGSINFDLVVDLREGAHHSGNWGGLLADPAMILAQALSTITDSRGALRIAAWRPDSLTDDLRAMLAQLPTPGTGGPDISADWGEPGLSDAERAFGWNSFAVLAMKSGVPEAPMNAISGSARATCQLRFVVGTDAENILASLRTHLDQAGFKSVQIISSEGAMFPATRTQADNPWTQRVLRSIEATTSAPPDILPNLAGSLPNHCFSDVLSLPTIWIPHSYAGCNQHAPNEHVLLGVCEDALGLMAGIYWDLGQSDQ
jgi:acetylornithine deacetylase/succinyl-diaminopimelate desuccinylase-like protein